jgi:D-arabinose 5-phosphate isomerase GutQ
MYTHFFRTLGDLGKISGSGNVVVCISASGETPEIKAILPHLQSRNVQVY